MKKGREQIKANKVEIRTRENEHLGTGKRDWSVINPSYQASGQAGKKARNYVSTDVAAEKRPRTLARDQRASLFSSSYCFLRPVGILQHVLCIPAGQW